MDNIKGKIGLTALFLFGLVCYAKAYSPELPAEINISATYSGPQQVMLNIDVKGDIEFALEQIVKLDPRLTAVAGNLRQNYILPANGSITNSVIVGFDVFFDYYVISVNVKDICNDCYGSFEKGEQFYLVPLEKEPLIMTFGQFYERLIKEPAFAEKLGFIVSESKAKPGIKGLFNYRKSELTAQEAKAFFRGEFKPQAFRPTENRKERSRNKELLASTYQRSGRISFYDDNWDTTYGVPRAEVAVVVYYTPAWEEVWGYGVTDDDGYYNVTFTIPDGQSLYESLVGIQVYLENESNAILVKHPTTGLYMGETIKNNYNWSLNAADAFYGPSKIQWSITMSYVASSSSGFGGGSVDVLLPKDTNEYRTDPDPNQIWLKSIWSWDLCLETASHEHGHHIMYANMGFSLGMPEWGLCSKKTPGSGVWGEGWAQFWATKIALYFGHDVHDPTPDSNPACSSISDSTAGNVLHALWDLYDGNGDEPYSYWSKMDDALRSTGSYTVYDYIAALKDQYEMEAIKEAIEDAIQHNLPPSPGMLLAAAESVPLELPKSFKLSQNCPNPFNPSTTISFGLLTEEGNVDLSIYNLRGVKVKTLLNGPRGAGTYAVFGDGMDDYGRKAASGIYFYRLTAGQLISTKKMVLIK